MYKRQDETPITYLNASFLSDRLALEISFTTTSENIITPIIPIEEATSPLPASRKLNVFPCFSSPPIIFVAFIIGAQKRKTVVNPQNAYKNCKIVYEGYVIMTIPPKEVNISDNDKSFLGENLSARTPPKIYDKNATVP